LGESNGKSTLGNEILGYNAFTTYDSSKIETKEFSLRKGGEKNNLFVIDSPPIEESSVINKKYINQLMNFIKEQNELNAIIFVFNYIQVRFPHHVQTILKFLFEIFKNKKLENHIALIFTNSFNKIGRPTPEDKCKKLDKIIPELKRIIEEENGGKRFSFPWGFVDNDSEEGNYIEGKMDLERIIAWASSLDNLIFNN
jgi:GTPase Era involved in 16S rRNA processing